MKIIRNVIGIILMLFGISWTFLNQFSCNKLCGSCSYGQLAPCYFLFLFVGIILIVSGVSLVLTSAFNNNRNEHKNLTN